MNQNIWKLAIEGMRGERKNTVLRILILFLSFLFIVVTLSVTASLNKTGEEYRYRQYGEWTSAVTDGAEQDRAVFLEDSRIQMVGTAQICGTVLGADGDSLTSIGTLDDSLLGMAHLSMQSGRMPESAEEVAMEADILSALGCPYELGQQIDLVIQRGSQTVEKTYTLCGIITEYTDVWCHGDALWAGAVLTQEAADTYGRADSYQFFLFTELTNVELVKSYGKTYSFLANTAVTGAQEVEQIYYGALALIFAVTAVAVFALYFVQMKEKVRSLALFRSIGATNRQLAQRLFCETVLAMLPALFLGTAAGAFITWLVLSLFLSIGVEQVCVAVPFVQLAAAAALWGITVFLAQLVILWNAANQPLVGTYLYLGGACIDGMLLLLMWNLLAGAGALNRRKYGILQALGMSERQKRQRIQKSGVVFVMTGFAVSTLTDGVALQGTGSAGMWGISIGLAIVLYLFYVVSQNHDLRGPLMDSIRSE